MKSSAPYTLLVNSSDTFEDCWDPFFTLYRKYWNPKGIPVLLNTEWKSGYSYPGVDIQCTRANAGYPERRLSWSECLLGALDQVETDLLIYMQEDYFLEAPVLNDLITSLTDYMQLNPGIAYIGLTHFGNLPPFMPWKDRDDLVRVGKTHYRISTQAGIWRKSALKSYLRPEENGWMFEVYGTRRAWNRKDVFLTLNREQYHQGHPAILYTHTGIIKGRWHPGMPSLFAKHGIHMDFDRRGFYREKPWIIRKWETGTRLMSSPGLFLKGMLGR